MGAGARPERQDRGRRRHRVDGRAGRARDSAAAGQLYVYQREPGWIEPKREREFTPRELWFYRHIPLAQRAHRAWLFYRAMRRFKGFDVNSKLQRQLREACLAFINRSIDDPAVREAVTPRYPWGCKRVVLASTFYEALNRPNVELVPHEVTRVTPTGLVDATGAERPVDVLILSTGFQPTSFLSGIEVKGRDGRAIHDAWQGRPNAFMGITVAGFPNFFILYGPNTNGGGSIIHQLERQAEVAANAVRRLERGTVFQEQCGPSTPGRGRSAGGWPGSTTGSPPPHRRWTPAATTTTTSRAARTSPSGRAPTSATRWRPACSPGSAWKDAADHG